jgi:hypothetical protein
MLEFSHRTEAEQSGQDSVKTFGGEVNMGTRAFCLALGIFRLDGCDERWIADLDKSLGGGNRIGIPSVTKHFQQSRDSLQASTVAEHPRSFDSL